MKWRLNVGGLIDRVIETPFPGWAMRRARARLAIMAARQQRTMLSRFDAAEKTRNTADWDSKNTSADAAIIGDYLTILSRARAAVRDDWAARSMVDGYVRHIVGTGITARSNARDPVTDVAQTDYNKAADRLWERWANAPTACDTEGRKTFLDVQALMVSEMVSVGQAFAILNYEPRPDAVGLSIQMFEPEQLDWSQKRNPDTGHEIRGGVEVDPYNRAIAYWVYAKGHPLDSGTTLIPTTRTYRHDSVRIPAEQVIHLFRQDRPRQCYGVSWFSAILRELWHTKMFEEYTLLRARFEACGGASIESDPGAMASPLLGTLGTTSDPTANDADANANKQLTFEPNMLWELPPGKKAVFHSPTVPGGQHVPYTTMQIKKIAAGGGLDFPTVSRDFSGNTFSGQRQGMLELWKGTDPEQLRLINGLCRRVRNAFIGYAILERRLIAPAWDLSDDWREAYLSAVWQPQPKQWIDPANQAAAAKLQLEQRLTTRRKILNELGEGVEQTFQQIADEKGMAADLGFKLPEDAEAKVAPQEPRPTGMQAGGNGEGRLTEVLDGIGD